MKILILFLSLFLVACSATTTELVPVAPPKRTLPPKPVLPIYSLDKNSSDADVAKAYVASVYKQQEWINAVDP